MIPNPWFRYMMGLLATQVLVVACSSVQSPVTPLGGLIQHADQNPTLHRSDRPRLPAEVLYVLGGTQKTRQPFINVFNAQDTAPNPTPLYTIPPNGDGGFGVLAVDSQNNLFVEKAAGSIVKLYMYPAGQSKPSVVCLLPFIPNNMSIAGNVLYIATRSNSINEYVVPFSAGKTCPSPAKTITDKIAERESNTGILGVSADPFGDVFDTWQASPANGFMDEFNAGSNHAHSYARLGDYYASFYMTSDRKGNMITNIRNSSENPMDSIAVFPRGSKVANLFDPINDGQYLGMAVATNDTELFVAVDYPTTEVQVYSYDAKTATVGSLKRTFTNVWYYAQSIAVFSQ